MTTCKSLLLGTLCAVASIHFNIASADPLPTSVWTVVTHYTNDSLQSLSQNISSPSSKPNGLMQALGLNTSFAGAVIKILDIDNTGKLQVRYTIENGTYTNTCDSTTFSKYYTQPISAYINAPDPMPSNLFKLISANDIASAINPCLQNPALSGSKDLQLDFENANDPNLAISITANSFYKQLGTLTNKQIFITINHKQVANLLKLYPANSSAPSFGVTFMAYSDQQSATKVISDLQSLITDGRIPFKVMIDISEGSSNFAPTVAEQLQALNLTNAPNFRGLQLYYVNDVPHSGYSAPISGSDAISIQNLIDGTNNTNHQTRTQQ